MFYCSFTSITLLNFIFNVKVYNKSWFKWILVGTRTQKFKYLSLPPLLYMYLIKPELLIASKCFKKQTYQILLFYLLFIWKQGGRKLPLNASVIYKSFEFSPPLLIFPLIILLDNNVGHFSSYMQFILDLCFLSC